MLVGIANAGEGSEPDEVQEHRELSSVAKE